MEKHRVNIWQHLTRRFQPPGRRSYAQCGEDMIAAHVLIELLKIEQPSYLDIGAHHATRLSNTYYFYRRGGVGVCVEPDPTLHAAIQRKRPRDLCLNVGIGTGTETQKQDFYIRQDRYLNSFTPPLADQSAASPGERVQSIVPIDLVPINNLLTRHFTAPPNFLSLDTEGMDLKILRAIDFGRTRPELLCVETLDFASQAKDMEITPYLQSVGYRVYADTFINTLYVEEGAWQRFFAGR